MIMAVYNFIRTGSSSISLVGPLFVILVCLSIGAHPGDAEPFRSLSCLHLGVSMQYLNDYHCAARSRLLLNKLVLSFASVCSCVIGERSAA